MNDHQRITDMLGEAAHMPLAAADRARRIATAALALAAAAELPILIEEAEGVLGRIEHNTTCNWCQGVPGAQLPDRPNFWCSH